MDNNDIQPLTVTVEQAAKLLGIGRSTAYELVHTGDIPSLRLGRRIVIPTEWIASLLGCGYSIKLVADPHSEPRMNSRVIAADRSEKGATGGFGG